MGWIISIFTVVIFITVSYAVFADSILDEHYSFPMTKLEAKILDLKGRIKDAQFQIQLRENQNVSNNNHNRGNSL